MRRLLRLRPSPAMGVALVALFVALGGSASALVVITSRNIKNGTIRGQDIHNSTITGKKIRGRVPLAANASGLNGPLAPGKTLTGVWATANGDSSTGYSTTHFEFRPPLARRLDANHVIFVPDLTKPHCPGVGRAEAGYFCVYLQQGAQTFQSIGDGQSPGAAPDGAEMFMNATQPNSFAGGHWAVSAPPSGTTAKSSSARRRSTRPNGQ